MDLCGDPYDEGFPGGFVYDELEKGQTPEMMLEKMKKQKQNP